jgi:hypothetical protein
MVLTYLHLFGSIFVIPFFDPQEMIKFPKISISAINGTTIGGGINLGLLWQDLDAWRLVLAWWGGR